MKLKKVLLIVLSLSFLTTSGANEYSALGKHINPVMYAGKGKFCSSSMIKYKGNVYAVTNRHCCAVTQPNVPDDYKIIGDSTLKVLFVSETSDHCIINTDLKRGLDLAYRPPKPYDATFVIGYPKGYPQTLRLGHFQYMQDVCIDYSKDYFFPDVRCVSSYVNSVIIRGGNSGSPLFNSRGYVIGIIYGASDIDSISTTLSQLKNALEEAHNVKSKR